MAPGGRVTRTEPYTGKAGSMIVYEVWNEVWEYRHGIYKDKGRAEEECQRIIQKEIDEGWAVEPEWIVVETRVE